MVGIYDNSQSQHGFSFSFGFGIFFFFFFKGRELLLGMALDFRLLIKKLLESMTIHNQERVYYTFTNMGLNSKKL